MLQFLPNSTHDPKPPPPLPVYVNDDAVFEAQGPNNVPIYSRFEGPERVKRFLTIASEMFETEAFEFRKWATADNFVFAYGYMQHRVRKTGRLGEACQVLAVENGLQTRMKGFKILR